MASSRVMVITGTTRGIGRGMAEFFLDRGSEVFGCGRSPATIEHDRYHHAELDVADEGAVEQWIRSVRRSVDAIDVLVCNAGAAPATSLLTLTSGETLREALDANVTGSFLVCREVAKAMTRNQAGTIITVSSMAVGLHQEGTSAYAASKAAIVEMTKILAKELAPVGITCNVVAPSMIDTDAVEALGDDIAERALADLTIPRRLTIDEICNVVTFFAAPESRAITGQVVHLGLVT